MDGNSSFQKYICQFLANVGNSNDGIDYTKWIKDETKLDMELLLMEASNKHQ